MVAHPLSDEHLGMEGSLISTAVIVVLYLCGVFMVLRWPRFRRLVTHKPVVIVQNGEILEKGLKKARISIDVLLEELREGKVKDIKTVAIAFWEADGNISFFLDPKYEGVTNEALKIKTEPFDFPRIVIKEGIVNYKELKEVGKDEAWVTSNIKKSYNTQVENVLLASLDRKGNMTVLLYK